MKSVVAEWDQTHRNTGLGGLGVLVVPFREDASSFRLQAGLLAFGLFDRAFPSVGRTVAYDYLIADYSGASAAVFHRLPFSPALAGSFTRK